MLCTTMPWWNYHKNTPVFRRGVKIPLCRHTTPLVEIRLRLYFQNNTKVLEKYNAVYDYVKSTVLRYISIVNKT